MNKFIKLSVIFGLMAGAFAVSASAQYGIGADYSGQCRGYYRLGSFGSSQQLQLLGLTSDQRLICFTENSPGDARTIGFITGLSDGDARLVGMDFRPATRDLYGVGNAGGVYRIDPATARVISRVQLSAALAGTAFGVDFNPVVDRLRIVSDTGQNLRVNVDTGAAIVDATLTYTAPPAAPAIPAAAVSAAAYTNNDTDLNTSTTLYVLDTALDQVVIQSPANSGILVATGKLTVDSTDAVGFDIYSSVRSGSATDLAAFASLTVGGRSGLYAIALASGRASSRGSFRSGENVIDIAIPLNQP